MSLPSHWSGMSGAIPQVNTDGWPKVLGLDLSLTSTGVAWPPADTRLIGRAIEARGVGRLQWLRAQIREKTWERGSDLVVVEGPSYGSQGGQRGHHERAGLFWLVVVDLHVDGIPYAIVPPASLKKYATGRGNAGKDDVMREVARRFPWFNGNNDAADALVLAAMGCDHLGQPWAPMPQHHREALSKVDWPEEKP